VACLEVFFEIIVGKEHKTAASASYQLRQLIGVIVGEVLL